MRRLEGVWGKSSYTLRLQPWAAKKQHSNKTETSALKTHCGHKSTNIYLHTNKYVFAYERPTISGIHIIAQRENSKAKVKNVHIIKQDNRKLMIIYLCKAKSIFFVQFIQKYFYHKPV